MQLVCVQSQDGSRAGQPQAGRQSQERAAVKQQVCQMHAFAQINAFITEPHHAQL